MCCGTRPCRGTWTRPCSLPPRRPLRQKLNEFLMKMPDDRGISSISDTVFSLLLHRRMHNSWWTVCIGCHKNNKSFLPRGYIGQIGLRGHKGQYIQVL